MFYSLLTTKGNGLLSQNKGGSFLLHRIEGYTHDLRMDLDAVLDKRLVRTFFDLFTVILMFRNRAMGLLLSELGGYICGFDHAPAGTKRIGNLLRSKKWSAKLIDDYFFDRTRNRISELLEAGKRPLLLWDDSRIEKHESWVSEGLCSVWSSKAKRLTRVRRGFYRPPQGRICVPGYKWTGVLLSHLGGVPSVCKMEWWTNRGKFKEDPDNIVYCLLKKIHQQIPQPIVHVLDRGYANTKMLDYFFKFNQDFIIRWKQNHLLSHALKGIKKTHLLARSFKAQARQVFYDKARKKHKQLTIAWAAVKHLKYPDQQLYLIIVRDRTHYNSPMYILTSLQVHTPKQAWEVMASYLHRWEVEQGFRFLKAEMGMESPRLWLWENRLKLMAIVTLVYDFLLKMLTNWTSIIQVIFRKWCHRTGERYRNASIPLYRLRIALSNCLYQLWFQNSG